MRIDKTLVERGKWSNFQMCSHGEDTFIYFEFLKNLTDIDSGLIPDIHQKIEVPYYYEKDYFDVTLDVPIFASVLIQFNEGTCQAIGSVTSYVKKTGESSIESEILHKDFIGCYTWIDVIGYPGYESKLELNVINDENENRSNGVVILKSDSKKYVVTHNYSNFRDALLYYKNYGGNGPQLHVYIDFYTDAYMLYAHVETTGRPTTPPARSVLLLNDTLWNQFNGENYCPNPKCNQKLSLSATVCNFCGEDSVIPLVAYCDGAGGIALKVKGEATVKPIYKVNTNVWKDDEIIITDSPYPDPYDDNNQGDNLLVEPSFFCDPQLFPIIKVPPWKYYIIKAFVGKPNVCMALLDGLDLAYNQFTRSYSYWDSQEETYVITLGVRGDVRIKLFDDYRVIHLSVKDPLNSEEGKHVEINVPFN